MLSVDPLPNVVAVLAAVPPDEDEEDEDDAPLPDDPLDEAAVVVTAVPLRTLVAGAPPPPPPPQAVKTNAPAAAANRAAVMFLCMKCHSQRTAPLIGRIQISDPLTHPGWFWFRPSFTSTTENWFVCGIPHLRPLTQPGSGSEHGDEAKSVRAPHPAGPLSAIYP